MNSLTVEKVRASFIAWCREAGYRETTLATKLSFLDPFFAYVNCHVADFRDVDENTIRAYLKLINAKVSRRTGEKYGARSKALIFAAIRLVFKSLFLYELILKNPARDVEYKAQGLKEKRLIMTQEEMAKLLDGIDLDHVTGLRDRALFELMYSSGLRIGEAAGLVIGDIDFENRMLLIRQGKWSKDRVVPVSRVAIAFLKQYLGNRKMPEEPVFLGSHGALRKTTINALFKNLLKRMDMYKDGLSAHSIRHSVATHLLSNGADLRYVQELLGHESIETTCIYTNELYQNMKRIYRTHHPRENELFREVDADYLARLRAFKEELEALKGRAMAHRQAARRYYERQKAIC